MELSRQATTLIHLLTPCDIPSGSVKETAKPKDYAVYGDDRDSEHELHAGRRDVTRQRRQS